MPENLRALAAPAADRGSTGTGPEAAVAESAQVRRARDGDLDAFEALYRRHVGRVHGLCLRLTGDRHRAEELTQEVFLRAWRKLGSFRGDSAFGTWLHRLAVNLVVGEHRRQSRHADNFLEGEDHAERPSPVRVDPASGVDLQRAIAALPAGARQVFLLYELEGYTHEEIARLIGVAPGTSRAQVFRARKLLRKVFSP